MSEDRGRWVGPNVQGARANAPTSTGFTSSSPCPSPGLRALQLSRVACRVSRGQPGELTTFFADSSPGDAQSAVTQVQCCATVLLLPLRATGGRLR